MAEGALVDFFLKIDGIEGESGDHAHKNEIQIDSWSWGESNQGSATAGGGMGSGKVLMQDFHFTMATNKASVKLFLHCANGKHIPSALLTCRKAGGKQEEYLKIKFTDLLVSSFQIGGSPSNILPHEQISFNFVKVEWEYKPQKEDGSLGSPEKAGWDTKKNEKV